MQKYSNRAGASPDAVKYVSTARRQRSCLCRPSRASVPRRVQPVTPRAPTSRTVFEARRGSTQACGATSVRKSGGGITSQSEGFRLLPGFRAALCRARCVARAQDRAESADGRWVSHAEVDWACACWLVACYLNQVPHCRSLRTPSLHPHHASPTRGTHLAEQYRGGCRRFLDSYVIATVACMRQASFIPR